ncbi:MAG TPA: hypothetical protein VGF28_04610 [Thermoanaerobaculia bacterium]|jgi:hypothetical protein
MARPTIRTALQTLRGEWFLLPSLAQRADRAMRTMAARSTARRVYAETMSLVRSLRRPDDTPRILLSSLAARPGWRRQSGQTFVHAFGSRQSEITIPAQVDVRNVAALVTRAEINALLGDSDWPLLSALQELAARELDFRFSAAAR